MGGKRRKPSIFSRGAALALALMLVLTAGVSTVFAAGENNQVSSGVSEEQGSQDENGNASGEADASDQTEKTGEEEQSGGSGQSDQQGEAADSDGQMGETGQNGNEEKDDQQSQTGETGQEDRGETDQSQQETNASSASKRVSLSSGNEARTPQHQKYIKYNGNDSYTLTLNVTGQAETITGEKPKVDVLLIVDRSGSMDEDYERRTSRLEKLQEVVTEEGGLTDAILNNEGIDARMAVVAYSGSEDWRLPLVGWTGAAYDDASTLRGWTSSKNQIDNTVNGISANGGTNCEAGLYQGANVLESAREEAQKFVIFLSDGDPTFYYTPDSNYPNDYGYTQGNGGNYDATAARHAVDQVKAIQGLGGFYTIGISKDSNQSFMKSLVNASDAEKKQFYSAAEADDLAKAFEEITADIINYTCRDITITDTLSDYVKLPGDSLEQAAYTATAVNENGQTQDISDVDIRVSYDKDTRTVTAEFPEDYVLEQGWTYSVSFHVEPAQAAYDVYAESGYPHTGSENSDAPGNTTSSGQAGFYSNTAATLTYTYGSQGADSQTVPYDESPVVQVSTMSVSVEKKWENVDTGAALPSVTVQLLRDGKEVDGKILTLSGANDWQAEFEDLAKNHEYSVREANVPDGYESTVSGDQENGFTITNTKLPSLTVSKEVTGEMGDKTASFTIDISMTSGGTGLTGSYSYTGGILDGAEGVTVPEDGTIRFENGEASITLKHGQTITIQNLPLNASYTVREDETSSAGYTVKYDGEEKDSAAGTLTQDMSAAVENHKGKIPVTGLEDSGVKAAAAGAGVLLLAGMSTLFLRRRRR